MSDLIEQDTPNDGMSDVELDKSHDDQQSEEENEDDQQRSENEDDQQRNENEDDQQRNENEDDQQRNENEDDNAAVFYIGSCIVQKGLRLEEESKSLGPNADVVIALQTKHSRGADESCAICYYDSEVETDETLEHEVGRNTIAPVGRYSTLCICENMSSEEEDDAVKIQMAYITNVCGHVFHTACIYKWIKSTTGGFSCPICRGGLVNQRIEGIPELYSSSPEYVVEYWPNGKVKSEHFELNKQKSGICKTYTSIGAKESECYYENGLKNGVETFFYPESRTVRSTTDFLNDQKNGKCCRFATDGMLIGESNWIEGKRSGRNVEFYTDSLNGNAERQMSSLEHYQNGEKHGIFMKWAFSGKLLMYGAYKNGERSGRFAAWFENTGGLRLKEFYVDGAQEGRSIEYHEIEDRLKKDHLDLVRLKDKHNVKEVCFYSHGLKIGLFRTFWRDGTRRVKTEYNDIGQLDGPYFEWNRFGKLFKELYYDAGELDGICQTYSPENGTIFETSCYKMGQMHGLYIQRYKSAGNAPKLVRLFKNGEEIYAKCFTRQGKIVWEHRKDEPSIPQAPKDTIAVKRPPQQRRVAKTRFV